MFELAEGRIIQNRIQGVPNTPEYERVTQRILGGRVDCMFYEVLGTKSIPEEVERFLKWLPKSIEYSSKPHVFRDTEDGGSEWVKCRIYFYI